MPCHLPHLVNRGSVDTFIFLVYCKSISSVCSAAEKNTDLDFSSFSQSPALGYLCTPGAGTMQNCSSLDWVDVDKTRLNCVNGMA